MMRRLFLLGLLLLPATGLATEADSLYKQIHDDVLREIPGKNADPEVAAYAAALFEDWDLSEEDAQTILNGDAEKLCGERAKEQTDPAGYRGGCMNMARQVQNMAEWEQHIRTLGRKLQAIATGYELPVADLPARAGTLNDDLQGIVRMWQAGTGDTLQVRDGTSLRRVAGDPAVYEPLLDAVQSALDALSDEERIAAVWRYRYGVRLVKGDRAPAFPPPVQGDLSGPGTERQYLFKRWYDVEDALEDLYLQLRSEPLNPPLGPEETAVLSLPEDSLKDHLPDNVIAWARNVDDYAPLPLGDAGLGWLIPLDPILPSLVAEKENPDDDEEEKPILGGTYPPEPLLEEDDTTELVDGRGLCTSPIARRGYLCRPIQSDSTDDACPDSGESGGGDIRLVHCSQTGSLRFTTAGADVCRDTPWKFPEAFDPARECKVQLACAPNCTVPQNVSALTRTKAADGTIQLCAREQSPDIQMTYLLYHELVHAQQLCALPPEFGYRQTPNNAPPEQQEADRQHNTALCCKLEGEAYRAQCDMMQRDGVFDGMARVDGIPFNAETCAEMFTDVSCSQRDGYGHCYTSQSYTQNFKQQMLAASGKNPRSLPSTCSEAISPATADLRVLHALEAVRGKDEICRPSTQTLYQSRIGNNLCFIGQCVEEAVERHAITPGRTAAGVADEEGPWQYALQGSPLATLFSIADPAQMRLPPYRPVHLMRSFDIALCQLQGLPPLTPPVLCSADASKVLELPFLAPLLLGNSLQGQRDESTQATDDLLPLASGYAARVGNTLYAMALKDASLSLSTLLRVAADMLGEITDIEFPTRMCPLGSGLPIPPSS